MYYINNFLFYSFFGYILENIVYFILGNKADSGFITGPMTPVYGCGILIILIFNKFLDKFKIKRLTQIIITFISMATILSLLEYIGGITIEILFKQIYWDYSNLKFNIGRYVALEIALVWGVLSILFIYIFKPLSDKIIKKVPNYITIPIFIIFIIDFIVTTIMKINI